MTTLLNRMAEAKDEAACAAFVGRYGAMVRTIARHAGISVEDAEDVGQEVMIMWHRFSTGGLVCYRFPTGSMQAELVHHFEKMDSLSGDNL